MSRLRIFIPTYNRAKIISTHKTFKDYDYTVVVHDEEQRDEYLRHVDDNGLDPERVVVSYADPGCGSAKEWILNNLVEKDEWVIMADDNITNLTGVDRPHYDVSDLPVGEDKSLRPIFDAELSMDHWEYIVDDTINEAKRVGAHLCAFALVDNFFFRGKKFRHVGNCIGKLTLLHRENDVPTEGIHTIWGENNKGPVIMEDIVWTAEHLLRWGKVVINNYVYPISVHFQEGGIGSKESRKPQRLIDVRRMMKRYPHLLRLKKGQREDVSFALTTKKVQQWRKWLKKEMGADYPYHENDVDSKPK